MSNHRSVIVLKQASSSLYSVFRGKGLFSETIKTMSISMIILLINMATGMITARMLGPEGRGLLAMLILWPTFLGFTTSLGIHSALLYHMKKTPEDEGLHYYASLILCAFTGIFALVLGVTIIPLIMNDELQTTILIAQCFMLVVPFLHLFFISNAYFRGREEFQLFNRMRYVVPLMTLISLLILMATDRLTVFTAGLSYFVPYVPITIGSLFRGMRVHRPQLRGLKLSMKRIFSYGMGSYGVDLLGNIVLYIDQIILVALLAPGPLGIYVVAVSLSRIVNIFSASIVMVLFPKVTGLANEQAALLTLRVFKLSTAFALVGAAAIMLIAPLLIKFLYGDQFMGAIPVFRLLLFEVVIGGSAHILAQSFMASGKPIIATILQAIGIVLVIPLMFILVPIYGIIGAGWALLIPSIVRLIFVVIVFQRKFKFNFNSLFIHGEDIRWLRASIYDRNQH